MASILFRPQCVNASHLSAAYVPWVNWVNAGSGNGLSPVRRQGITWTNADLLSLRLLGTNFGEVWFEIQNVSFIKCHVRSKNAICEMAAILSEGAVGVGVS